MLSSIDLADKIAKAGQFVIDNDRVHYVPMIKHIESDIATKRDTIFLGGVHGRTRLIEGGGPAACDACISVITRDYFVVGNPFFIARDLADSMYSAVSSHFIDMRLVEVKTVLRNEEAMIMINGIAFFRFLRMRLPHVTRNAPLPFMARDGLVGPLLQTIDVLQALYTPKKLEEWPQLAQDLCKLLELLPLTGTETTQKKQKPQKRGGDDSHDDLSCEFEHNALEDAATEYFGGDEEGDLKDIPEGVIIASRPGASRPIFLSDRPVKEIARFYGQKSRVASYELFITGDWRLKKYTIYDNDGTTMCNVYNSPEYEMIPLQENGTAHALVIARFMLIEALMGRIIAYMSGRETTSSSFSGLSGLSSLLKDAVCPQPGDKYAGVFIDEGIAKKHAIDAAADRLASYFPAKGIKNHEEN